MKHRGNPDDCFQAVLLLWLQDQPKITDLLNALRSPVVYRNDVADEVETNINQGSW